MCVDKLSDRSYVVDVDGQVLWRNRRFLKPTYNWPPGESTEYGQGQDDVSEVKEGNSTEPVTVPGVTSDVPVPRPDMEGQAPASTQERNGKEGVKDQGREPQVEVQLEPQETAARQNGYKTRSGRVVREPSRYQDYRRF